MSSLQARKALRGEFRAQALATEETVPPERRELSVTQLSTWLACKYRWRYAYILGITPKKRKEVMERGSLVHEFLAALFEGKKISPDISTSDEPLVQEALAIARRAYESFPKGYEVATINGVRAVELALSVPLPGFAGFKGYVDVVVRDKATGNYWLVDHKVRRSITGPDDLEVVNLQMAVYQHMLIHAGYPTVGSIMYQISNCLPAVPELTQKGELSRRKIKTDAATYLREIRRHGLDPGDYADLLFKLKQTRFDFAHRTYRSPEEIENIWNQIVRPATQEIHDYLSEPDAHYQRAWNKWECRNCAYLRPCTEEIAGRDPAWILQNDYEAKKGRPQLNTDGARQ